MNRKCLKWWHRKIELNKTAKTQNKMQKSKINRIQWNAMKYFKDTAFTFRVSNLREDNTRWSSFKNIVIQTATYIYFSKKIAEEKIEKNI